MATTGIPWLLTLPRLCLGMIYVMVFVPFSYMRIEWTLESQEKHDIYMYIVGDLCPVCVCPELIRFDTIRFFRLASARCRMVALYTHAYIYPEPFIPRRAAGG